MNDRMRQIDTPGDESGLSPAQELAVEALVSGSAMTDAAIVASVSRSTVHRWLRDPLFVAALNGRRAELRDSTQASLQRLQLKALEAIERALDAGDRRVAMTLLKGLGLLEKPQIGSDEPERVAKQQRAAANNQELLDMLGV